MRLALLPLFAAITLHAATPVPENLTADGIPPIPEELRAEVGRYLDFRSASFGAWHPRRREMLISTRFADTAQIHVVKKPGGARTQITFGSEPIRGVAMQPETGKCFVYGQDTGGGEFYQLYRFDLAAGRASLLTDGQSRNTGAVWSRDGKQLAYTSTRRTGKDNDVRLMDPFDPKTDREIFQAKGGGWGVESWSHDGKKLLLSEYLSANESRLHLLDPATGRAELLTPPGAEKVAWGKATFAQDDRSILALCDQGSEFARLVRLDLATKAVSVLTEDLPWDVDDLALSPNGRRIAIVSNEDGASVLRILDAQTGALVSQPTLPLGVLGGIEWFHNNRELGFSLNSARSPTDAWSLDLATGLLTRWTESETGGLDARQFVEPEIVRLASFDGVKISGFLYRPDAKKFPGPRPLLISIHGGPEGQALPLFQGRYNFLINELGLAIFEPNVRGSAGYGKTFLTLDNGFQREDSVRDIGAFLEALGRDPALDRERFGVIGGSYGGYMVLACLVHFGDRLRCGIDIVGISNFISFLKNTQDYRRDLRRVEYGDERDPAMAAHLEKISPLQNVTKITRPLFVVQGKNDPRVPVTEAEQIVKAMREAGRPCWYLVAADEGHGFAKKPNADFQFLAQILFLREYLLAPAPAKSAQFGADDWVIVPLRVHLLSSKSEPALHTTLTEQDLARILPKMNRVWAQAGIQFRVESLIREEAPTLENADSENRGALPLRMPRASRAETAFNVYYVKKLDVNGFYTPRGIFVKDTAALRPVEGGIDEPIPRVTSHELGHALSLPHRQDRTNLMASDTTGTLLNDAEIQQARVAAKKFAWIESASTLRKRVEELSAAGKAEEAAALREVLAKLPGGKLASPTSSSEGR